MGTDMSQDEREQAKDLEDESLVEVEAGFCGGTVHRRSAASWERRNGV